MIQPIPTCTLVLFPNGGTFAAGAWVGGIPTGPPSASIGGVTGGNGNGNAANVFSSPPTLGQQYVVTGYTIPFGLAMTASPDPTNLPNFACELDLLLNGDVAASNTLTAQVVVGGGDSQQEELVINDTWVADLVNPLIIGARDRLGLQIKVQCDQNLPVINEAWIAIGQQIIPSGGWQAPAASLSYTPRSIPLLRRL